MVFSGRQRVYKILIIRTPRWEEVQKGKSPSPDCSPVKGEENATVSGTVWLIRLRLAQTVYLVSPASLIDC
jgi:hypothetical protein